MAERRAKMVCTLGPASQDEGVIAALDPGSYDASLNDNADAIPWCVATQPYGDGDFGTPKEMNLVCG